MASFHIRPVVGTACAALTFAGALGAADIRTTEPAEAGVVGLGAAPIVEPDSSADIGVDPAALGRSGALRVRQALPRQPVDLPLRLPPTGPLPDMYWTPVLGTVAPEREVRLVGGLPVAPDRPGNYRLQVGTGEAARPLDAPTVVVRVPFESKDGSHLRGYFIGRYPTEGQDRTDRYAPPEGFIEVTRANQDMQLSEHFKLREFLTHDQADVWPKYVVVDELLLDKLELVFDELGAMGVEAEHMIVMSGFRTPQYNEQGLNAGRAKLSRHQYGDAADVWVDNDGDWYMDDLNGDGRRDTGDSRVMLEAVRRVEAKHPRLVGGAGVYRDNGVHGPFLHIDTRGYRARW